ncbi:hypothetical protein AJ78_07374 [Emergomyces pasteurianus Ep9510]|uniref:Uncharacterized protein n=1 Tax=Emergomyces pasteurianus Ep9510 TaxID=1447872 RepID=A0A1J9PVP8_9EURO|nr:hypothetical protein AJ78_07374 [Emergomyces pasteurianus Ep9510]
MAIEKPAPGELKLVYGIMAPSTLAETYLLTDLVGTNGQVPRYPSDTSLHH